MYGIAHQLAGEPSTLRAPAARTGRSDERRRSRPSPDKLKPRADHDLAATLATLDPAQRDLLLLQAWGDLSYEQIAEGHGVAVGTGLSRALARRFGPR
ncbi:MAG: hypothetical protein JO342_08640 [Solirubrobacterales bacterium]|nr:hypothetical protein [Solirubrobacterales bacterium]